MNKLIAALILIFTTSVMSQSVITLDANNLPAIKSENVIWQFKSGQSAFACVIKTNDLKSAGLKYNVLDSDAEIKKYFYLESIHTVADYFELNSFEKINVIWREKNRAIISSRTLRIPWQIQQNYRVKRIDFLYNPPIENKSVSAVLSDNLPENPLQEIVVKVNPDSMYLTEQQLSGETAVIINGQLDSIMTRYSYSPQIFTAQNYIAQRLENYGYPVDIQPFGELNVFYDICFSPTSTDSGWAVTDDKIYLTTDGGQTWQIQYRGTTGSAIWSVYALDSQHIYAVGDYGLILTTTDGGQTWQKRNSPVYTFLFGVYFIDEMTGWICGDTGYILKTTNGGATWLTKSTPATDRLYEITFVNSSTGYAVGRNGRILKSTNGGDNWSSLSSGTSERLYDVHFSSETTGFVVGWGHTILKTGNSGSTWNQYSGTGTSNLYSVDFISPSQGFIAGWGGTFLKTNDAGNNWATGGNISNADVYGLEIVDLNNIWVSGNGVVAKSADLGVNWQNMASELPEGSINNVIATKTGTQIPNQEYIICAHYDATSNNPSVRAPGADDNATGTTTVIEAARIFRDYNFKYTVKFVLFSGEEQGLYGSAHYAANASANGDQILGVLNLDMTGYDSDNNGIIEIHAGNLAGSQSIANTMQSAITEFGLPLSPQYITSGATGASDHASFWDYGYPALLLIEDFQDFTPYYHTTNDLLSTLNFDYFCDNARLAIGTLATLAELDTSTTTNIEPEMLPGTFQISKLYPNPFNSILNMEIYLPQAQQISISVYNLLGQKIAEVIPGKYFTSRQHNIQWNMVNSGQQNLASGVYIMEIRSAVASDFRKFVYLK